MSPRAQAPADPREPLTPTRLGQIEAVLGIFDLTPMIRRQMICVVVKDQVPKPVFNEAYISIDELAGRLMPNVDLMSDRWLFQRLTYSLDNRLLKVLPEIESEVGLPTSINANIQTLLGEHFEEFDRRMRSRQNKSVILELQPFDVVADLAKYFAARDLAHQKGYRICLDALSSLTLPLLRRGQLGIDMAKIAWQADEFADLDKTRRAELAQDIRSVGPTRVVLCHCDDERALAFGREIGVTLYQGRYIDSLLERHGGATSR